MTWQDIDTAPMDGTEILTYQQHVRYRGRFVVVHFFAEAWGGDGGWSDGEYDYQPTHWMPLPDPPAALADQE